MVVRRPLPRPLWWALAINVGLVWGAWRYALASKGTATILPEA